jgi:chloramphenicol-sensitive protein RarD
MASTLEQQRDSRAGILFGLGTYLFWGLMPLYWRLLLHVPAFETTVHRILWCMPFMLILVLVTRRWRATMQVLRNPRLLAMLTLTAILIAANWGIFIWCVVNGHLVQSSLGYYINPLISILLGVAFLGERMGVVRKIAVLLAATAVLTQTIAGGEFPTIALVLALCFAFYGYIRKIANVPAVEGMFAESLILLPASLGLVIWWGVEGTGAFLKGDWYTDALLILSGPLTAIPLMTFTAAARRVRLSTIGFMQYITPSVVLLQATLLWGEPFTWVQAASFVCIWIALGLLALEGPVERLMSARARPKAPAPDALSPGPDCPPPK